MYRLLIKRRIQVTIEAIIFFWLIKIEENRICLFQVFQLCQLLFWDALETFMAGGRWSPTMFSQLHLACKEHKSFPSLCEGGLFV